MEREAPQQALQGLEEPGPHPGAAALLQGVSALAQADPDHRPKEALALIERLRQVQPGAGEAMARSVVRALEDPEFRRAETPEGVSCRAEAVRALLRLGYPFALQVRPEDLLYFRQHGGSARGRSLGVVTALAVLLMGLGAGTWLWLSRQPPPAPPPAPIERPLRPARP